MGKRATTMRAKGRPVLDGRKLHGSLDVAKLAAEQGIGPIDDLGKLKMEAWPQDEAVHDFVEQIYRWRREER